MGWMKEPKLKIINHKYFLKRMREKNSLIIFPTKYIFYSDQEYEENKFFLYNVFIVNNNNKIKKRIQIK